MASFKDDRSVIATHSVRVTRERLSFWFDERYDDGFAWSSKAGGELFEKLRSKNILVFRNAESTYQVLRDKEGVKWQDARWQKAYTDSPLTELGKVQAAALAVRYGLNPKKHGYVDALTFPACFLAHLFYDCDYL